MRLERCVLECCSQSTAESNKNHTDPSNINPLTLNKVRGINC